MFANGNGDREGLSGLERLKRWGGERLKRLGHQPVLRDYEDTLRRLLIGGFGDLSPQARRDKVEQIISISAMAAMATASAPIPFLELPVQLAMVRAIAKVNGVERPGRKVLWELVGALGGGLFLRQVLKMVPLAGSLPYLSRIYGATFGLGRVAHAYFSKEIPENADDLRRMFSETARKTTTEQSERMARGDLEAQLRYLDDLLARRVVTPEEHRKKRDQLLGRI